MWICPHRQIVRRQSARRSTKSRIFARSRNSAPSSARSLTPSPPSCAPEVSTRFTGRTGEGKTAFLVLLTLAIATGRSELIGRKVTKGRVAIATAENPDDLRMRLMVACFVFNIDVDVNLTKRAVEMALKRLKGDRLVVVKAKRWTLTKDGEGMVNEGQK
jgi:hypothetical protein